MWHGHSHSTLKQFLITELKGKNSLYFTNKLFSVAGFSLEFALLNPSGFFFYSTYSVAGSVDPYIGTGTVKLNDLVFALHALVMSTV